MKYVGEAMSGNDARAGISHVKSGQAQPIIGIASWGVIAGRDELAAGGPHAHIDKLKSKGKMNVNLQDDHNVFMLVDDGTEDKFGREVAQRSALESEIRRVLYNENANKLSAAVSGGNQCRILETGMYGTSDIVLTCSVL